MNRTLLLPLWLSLSFVLLAGCQKKIKYEKTESGLEYHFFTRNEKGIKGEVGDYYMLDLIVRRANDSVYKNSADLGGPSKFVRSKSLYPGDLYEALSMVAVGDSLIIKVIADSFFKSHGAAMPPDLEPGETLTFQLKVREILKEGPFKMKMFEEELDQMESFISRKKWNINTDTTGIKYEVLNPQKGPNVSVGDTAEISYLYYFLSEKIIARSKPGDNWKMEVGNPNTINGLSRLLCLLRNKEKVRAVIPFEQAFGDEGTAGMPPYSTIVMEIEVHNVIKKK
jgi:FKBP-type peptidyl-prolyl cis-trans isomerase FkpA